MASGPMYGTDDGAGNITYEAQFTNNPNKISQSQKNADWNKAAEVFNKYGAGIPLKSTSESTVEGTVEQKASSASSSGAKKQTNSAAQKSGAGMAGSILHAKGGVADTASGALEGNSKKAKTLG